MPGTNRVALVGAALSDIGRVDTKTPFELHYQAASRAIADAGLTKADIDGFGSSGMGLLAPVEVAEYLGLRPTWADGTGVGGSTWEFMVEHADRRDPRRARRDGRARLRIDGARRPQSPAPQREPLVRRPRTRAVRRAVRPHAHLEVRDGRAAPHVRVRHDHRAARRDRGVDAVQRVAEPRGVLPGSDHHRRRAERADDGGPAHQAALLHPQRRRRRGRADHRGAGPRPAQGTGVGARHRRGDVAHDDERVGGLHRVARRPQRPARVRARRRAARRHRPVPDLRRVHADGAALARRPRLLQEG